MTLKKVICIVLTCILTHTYAQKEFFLKQNNFLSDSSLNYKEIFAPFSIKRKKSDSVHGNFVYRYFKNGYYQIIRSRDSINTSDNQKRWEGDFIIFDYSQPIKDSLKSVLKEDSGLERNYYRLRLGLNFLKTVNFLQEPSTISPGANYYNVLNGPETRRNTFLLDVDISAPIPIGGKYWTGRKGNFVNLLHFTPGYKVRIFNNSTKYGDKSTPVRTPSYIPSITYYFTWKKLYHNDPDLVEFEESNPKHFFGFRIFHHSNGQDQPEFDTISNNLNIYNGNFGEHAILEFSYQGFKTYNWSIKKTLKCLKLRRYVPRAQDSMKIDMYWKLRLESRPLKVMSNEVFAQANLYGRHRLKVGVGLVFHGTYYDALRRKDLKFAKFNSAAEREILRLTLNIDYILDDRYRKGNLIKNEIIPFINPLRLNAVATVYWRVTGTPFSSLFAQIAYYGSDPYNIYFQQQAIQFRAGIALGFFKYPKN